MQIQMPVLPADTDWVQFLVDLTDRALSGTTPGVTILAVAPAPDSVAVPAMFSGLYRRSRNATRWL